MENDESVSSAATTTTAEAVTTAEQPIVQHDTTSTDIVGGPSPGLNDKVATVEMNVEEAENIEEEVNNNINDIMMKIEVNQLPTSDNVTVPTDEDQLSTNVILPNATVIEDIAEAKGEEVADESTALIVEANPEQQQQTQQEQPAGELMRVQVLEDGSLMQVDEHIEDNGNIIYIYRNQSESDKDQQLVIPIESLKYFENAGSTQIQLVTTDDSSDVQHQAEFELANSAEPVGTELQLVGDAVNIANDAQNSQPAELVAATVMLDSVPSQEMQILTSSEQEESQPQQQQQQQITVLPVEQFVSADNDTASQSINPPSTNIESPMMVISQANVDTNVSTPFTITTSAISIADPTIVQTSEQQQGQSRQTLILFHPNSTSSSKPLETTTVSVSSSNSTTVKQPATRTETTSLASNASHNSNNCLLDFQPKFQHVTSTTKTYSRRSNIVWISPEVTSSPQNSFSDSGDKAVSVTSSPIIGDNNNSNSGGGTSTSSSSSSIVDRMCQLKELNEKSKTATTTTTITTTDATIVTAKVASTSCKVKPTKTQEPMEIDNVESSKVVDNTVLCEDDEQAMVDVTTATIPVPTEIEEEVAAAAAADAKNNLNTGVEVTKTSNDNVDEQVIPTSSSSSTVAALGSTSPSKVNQQNRTPPTGTIAQAGRNYSRKSNITSNQSVDSFKDTLLQEEEIQSQKKKTKPITSPQKRNTQSTSCVAVKTTTEPVSSNKRGKRSVTFAEIPETIDDDNAQRSDCSSSPSKRPRVETQDDPNETTSISASTSKTVEQQYNGTKKAKIHWRIQPRSLPSSSRLSCGCGLTFSVLQTFRLHTKTCPRVGRPCASLYSSYTTSLLGGTHSSNHLQNLALSYPELLSDDEEELLQQQQKEQRPERAGNSAVTNNTNKSMTTTIEEVLDDDQPDAKSADHFDNEDEDDENEDDEKEETESFEGFTVKDIVWAQTKYGNWPAVIMEIMPFERILSVNLIEYPFKKFSIRVSLDSVMKYQEGIDDFRNNKQQRENQTQFLNAVCKAEAYERKKFLDDEVLDPMKFFNFDKDEIMGSLINSTGKSIEDTGALSSSTSAKDHTGMLLPTVDETRLFAFIKEGRVDTHLLGVYRKTIDSERHRLFEKQERKKREEEEAEVEQEDNEEQPRFPTGFGPIKEEEHKDELFDFCKKLFETHINDFIYDVPEYIYRVWLPEAITKAIQKLYHVDMKMAEAIFVQNSNLEE